MKRRFLRLYRRKGFILVESIGAFTVLSLTMIVLSVSVSQAVKNDLRADFELTAARFARSQFDRLGMDVQMDLGVRSGLSPEGLEWSLETSLYASSQTIRAYQLRMVVRNANNIFAMSTIKLAQGVPKAFSGGASF